ncbi:MAG: energy-dependent translational throttle protein EttA [Deltaproteobacteria bacterium]|nr:energy-dependent translational throttle protein EttA [Deltaproteobacteria bacterium]
MGQQFIYTMIGVRKVHPPDREVIKSMSLSFFFGAKIGVLGHNGSGKSTLLRIMAGLDTEFTGEAKAAAGIKIGFLEQEPQLDPDKTVVEHVEMAVAETRGLLTRFEEIGELMGQDPENMDELLEEYGELQNQIEAVDAWELDRTVERAMDALRLPPGDADVTKLSGGERRRVALCQLLLSAPDMLLLDEPTNHLDTESVAWLERFLEEYPGTVVAVTHDRYFLDNVAGWILELENGHGFPYEGNYTGWLEQKQKRLEIQEKQASARQRTLQRELEWVRMSPRARQAKGKARLTAYESLLSDDANADQRVEAGRIYIPPGQRLGDLVIETEALRKGYDDKLLIEDLSFQLPPGGIVGVIGANGAGKTTLFRLFVGDEQPDGGEIRFGDTVDLAYVDQSRDALDPDATVWEEISGGEETIVLGRRETKSRAYVSSFNFSGSDQQKRVGNLSGGERNRVHLAKLLRKSGNVLLLDEPTNDLDVDTLRSLEDALLDFAGCAVVVSHDRWFLNRIATHILAFEGDSHVEWFAGNYEDYEKDRKRRLGDDADQPHRIRYRKLSD